jgi:hypothetical protein
MRSKHALSRRKDLVLIVASTVLGSLVWLSLLVLLWRFLQARGFPADLWALIESVSTAVAAAAVFSAAFVAYRELAESASSRHLEIVDRLLAELNSTENIEARRWIFQNLPPDPQESLAGLVPEGRAAIKRVLNSLDRVAFLTQPGWVDEAMVMPWMNPMVVKAWARLEPYVEYERRRRKEPDYYQAAAQLAQRCRRWRAENLPEAEITWVEDAL